MEKNKFSELIKNEALANHIRDNADQIMENIKRNALNHSIERGMGSIDELKRQIEKISNEKEQDNILQKKKDKQNFTIGIIGAITGVLGLLVAIIALIIDAG